MNEIREKLYEKMEKEYEDYKAHLLTLSPQEIINKSYETVMKEEILSYLYPDDKRYDIKAVKALNNQKQPLDYLYREWMDCDSGINESLEPIISDAMHRLSERKKDELCK